PHRRQHAEQPAGEPTPAVQTLPRRPHGQGPVIRPAAQPGWWPMKVVGYALVTLGAVALVRGLWLMTPVAGWIGLALIAYVVGYHLSGRDGGVTTRRATVRRSCEQGEGEVRSWPEGR